MSSDDLVCKLTKDLTSLHLPIDEVDLSIRPYSSTFYGRYYPSASKTVRPRIFIYPYSDKQGGMYSYPKVLETAIHEMVHHIQHSDSSFKRVRGVMHDTNFWKLYQRYVTKAEEMIGGVISA